MPLKDYSDAELRQELARRDANIILKTKKPTAVEAPDFGSVAKLCHQVVNELADHGYCDGDLKVYIYEEAMSAVFGPGVWDWMREHNK